MYKIRVELEGLAPFLYNRMGEAERELLDSGKTGIKRTVEQRTEEAHGKVHRAADGSLSVPGENIEKCLEQAASQTRMKDAKVSMSSLLKATVFVDGHGTFRTQDYTIFPIMGRIPPGPRGKAAIIRRPRIETGWRLHFTLNVVDDARQPEMLREIIEHAGLYIGLGSWRPRYGRFIIIGWEVVGRKDMDVPRTPPQGGGKKTKRQ
mgnify:CR=1 FL=1